jgi:hypothetical protein
MAIPEFILRKRYVQGSFQTGAEGFSFALNNTFVPAAPTRMGLEVDGQPVPPDRLILQLAQGESRAATSDSGEWPALRDSCVVGVRAGP